MYEFILTVDWFLLEYFVGIDVLNRHNSEAVVSWSVNGANKSLVIKPNERIKRMLAFHIIGLPVPVSFTSYVSSTKKALLINGKKAVAFRPKAMKSYYDMKIECELTIILYIPSFPSTCRI